MNRPCRTPPAATALLFGVAVLLAASTTTRLAAQLPTPADVIGFAPGEDYRLAPYAPIARYFEELAASTDRMLLARIAESYRGAPRK